MTQDPKRDDIWTDWGRPPSPREYFEQKILGERELREKDWTAHMATHTTGTVTLAHTVELLNDVQRRFVDKGVFEAQMSAIEARVESTNRLALGLLGSVIILLAGVIVTLATR